MAWFQLRVQMFEQLSRDGVVIFLKAASVLQENFYMDDAMCGAETLEEVKDLN